MRGAATESDTAVTVTVALVSSPVAAVPTRPTTQRPAWNVVVTCGPVAVAPPGSSQRYETASPAAVSVVVSGAAPSAGAACTVTAGGAATALCTGNTKTT